MGQARSIRVRLSLVFLFFFLLIILLGCFGIWTLAHLNEASAQIRDHWIESIRILGDLNNFTSDLRAAEGGILLSSRPGEVARNDKDIADLHRLVAESRHNYRGIPHDAGETDLYEKFEERWAEYDKVLTHVLDLAHRYRPAEAVALYETASRSAYDDASNALGLLTAHAVESAREASRRSEEAYREARRLIGIAMLLATLMVAAVLLYIRRSISKPLLDLAACMHRLAGFAANIDIPATARGDEIGEMARALVVFRDNAIELAVSQRGLAQQASMLKEKLAEEQRLALLQRNFVSMASHEFRTPLTVIDGHAQRLMKMKARLDADEVARRAGAIRGAVHRISSLIDNLLGSARLVNGEFSLYYHPAAFELSKLLHEVCDWHRQVSPRSDIVEHICGGELPMIGDAKLLFQVFGNLLGNAIKYSRDGGLITVTARSDPDWATVTIEDRGIGIPEREIERLFEPYYRGSNVSGIVGAGIGLFFVKMVVDLHGGEIGVATRVGKGSAFTVRLPVRPP
jgi:two-component system, OmpR family, sensor kinase